MWIHRAWGNSNHVPTLHSVTHHDRFWTLLKSKQLSFDKDTYLSKSVHVWACVNLSIVNTRRKITDFVSPMCDVSGGLKPYKTRHSCKALQFTNLQWLIHSSTSQVNEQCEISSPSNNGGKVTCSTYFATGCWTIYWWGESPKHSFHHDV